MQEQDRDALARLGLRLRDVRYRRGLTQAGAAALTGGALSPTGISRLETGTNPRLTSLAALAVAYDMDLMVTRRGELTIHGTRLAMEVQR